MIIYIWQREGVIMVVEDHERMLLLARTEGIEPALEREPDYRYKTDAEARENIIITGEDHG